MKVILVHEVSVEAASFQQVGDVRYSNDAKYAYATVSLNDANGERIIATEWLLWEGADYDAMGQWQDADVQKRLTEIFSNNQ